MMDLENRKCIRTRQVTARLARSIEVELASENVIPVTGKFSPSSSRGGRRTNLKGEANTKKCKSATNSTQNKVASRANGRKSRNQKSKLQEESKETVRSDRRRQVVKVKLSKTTATDDIDSRPDTENDHIARKKTYETRKGKQSSGKISPKNIRAGNEGNGARSAGKTPRAQNRRRKHSSRGRDASEPVGGVNNASNRAITPEKGVQKNPFASSELKSFASPQKIALDESVQSNFTTPTRAKNILRSPDVHKSPTTPRTKSAPRNRRVVQSGRALKQLFTANDEPLSYETSSAVKLEPRLKEPLQSKGLVNELYSIIRRQFGDLGGGSTGGPIYGEITNASFQRVLDCLKERTGLGSESVFLDVGAGLGKPSFHAALDPGVKLSLGVEVMGGRWWQSMCLLKNLLMHDNLRKHAGRVFLAHADVVDMKDLNPVTHVYSFNRGFPPYAMRALAKLFHISHSTRYFICFDKPKTLTNYGFDLSLLHVVTTKMEGSGEQHRCYVYERNDVQKPVYSKAEVIVSADWNLISPPTDSEFAPHVPHSTAYLEGLVAKANGLDAYAQWAYDQVGLDRCTRSTRSRRNEIRG